MTLWKDLADLQEDDRIVKIGKAALTGAGVVFVVETEGAGGGDKADRYVRKLTTRFPQLREVERYVGPATGMLTVKVGRVTP